MIIDDQTVNDCLRHLSTMDVVEGADARHYGAKRRVVRSLLRNANQGYRGRALRKKVSREVRGEVGLSPLVWYTIIKMILEYAPIVIEWLRERRKDRRAHA